MKKGQIGTEISAIKRRLLKKIERDGIDVDFGKQEIEALHNFHIRGNISYYTATVKAQAKLDEFKQWCEKLYEQK